MTKYLSIGLGRSEYEATDEKAMSAIAEAKNEWGTKSAQCGAIRRPFWDDWTLLDEPCLLKPEQVPARHEEVCQRGDDEQPIAVLLQSAVAHLGEAEDAL